MLFSHFRFAVFLVALLLLAQAEAAKKAVKTVTKHRTRTITVRPTPTVTISSCKRDTAEAHHDVEPRAVVGDTDVEALGLDRRARRKTKTVTITRTVTKTRGAATSTVTVTKCDTTPAPAPNNGGAGGGTVTTTGPGYDGVFATDQVQIHNVKRAIHQVGSLSWNQTLADFAMRYANTCPSGHSHAGYGENLAWGAPTSAYGSQNLFDLWYAEGDDYDYSQNNFNSADGHFTQIIWSGTTQIGCALVSCPAQYMKFGADYRSLFCEYSPAGNVQGTFTKNVFPPKPSS
jgi:uncharacterized protein YkwD